MRTLIAALFALLALPALAAEALIVTAKYADGEVVPYILDAEGDAPRYVVILFPGGTGVMDPRMEDGKLVYGIRGNFLIRSRRFLVDRDFATVSTNTTTSEERVQALLDDIRRRYPQAKIYVMGTSNGTSATMRLAEFLSDKVAGEIHTSSLYMISRFDPRPLKNRHLIVHHREDFCRVTPFGAAQDSHERYGTDFIVMEGGLSTGDRCEAFAYHGYNGIERETIDKIKDWIRKGG